MDRPLQPERQDGLGRDDNVFVARKSRACCTCAGADQAADEGAFSTARQSADERASATTTADKASGPFAFTLLGAFYGARCDLVSRAISTHRIQPEIEFRRPLEAAQRLSVRDRPPRGGARLDHCLASHSHRRGYGRSKSIPGLADLRTQILAN